MNKKRTGFTLSEVLIVLGVIGVIAVIVISAVYNNISDAQYKVSWKKEYNSLTEATTKILLENSGSLANVCSDSECLYNLYKPYMISTKACLSSPLGACWSIDLNNAYIFNCSVAYAMVSINLPDNAIVLNDGSMVGFRHFSSNCNDSTYTGLPACGQIDVDVNGLKGPNKYGKDIYSLHVQSDGLIPFGSPGDNYVNTCSTTGRGCAQEYLGSI